MVHTVYIPPRPRPTPNPEVPRGPFRVVDGPQEDRPSVPVGVPRPQKPCSTPDSPQAEPGHPQEHLPGCLEPGKIREEREHSRSREKSENRLELPSSSQLEGEEAQGVHLAEGNGSLVWGKRRRLGLP